MLQQSTLRSLPQCGCLVRGNRERDLASPPRGTITAANDQPPGFARMMALPSPLQSSLWYRPKHVQHVRVCLDSLTKPPETQHVGSQGEQGRADNQNLISVIIRKLGLFHPSLMEDKMGDSPSRVNQHNSCPRWHHIGCPGLTTQPSVSRDSVQGLALE